LVIGFALGLARPVDAERFGPDLEVNSEQYIVIDAETGEIFASRDPDEQVAMASLTKVFTAVQAIEEAPLDTMIETDTSDLMDATHSTMGFQAGEALSLEDLLYGLMLPSGNDAAHAIARALGYQEGDAPEEAVDRFVARTNQRIKDVGLTDTNLVNPHGYGVPGHYTTAHDLAVFTMYALQYPTFETLISTREFTASNGQYLRNNNRLLNMGYEPLLGGKTGFDNDAGWCLIEVARRDGNTMISVTLDGIAPDDWYDDNAVLLDHAFEQKEARGDADDGMTNPTVAFLDPDAAAIARTSIGGASVGSVLASTMDAAQTSSEGGATGGEADRTLGLLAATQRSGSDGPNGEVLVVVGVAFLIFAARALSSYASPSRRPRSALLPATRGAGRPRRSRRVGDRSRADARARGQRSY